MDARLNWPMLRESGLAENWTRDLSVARPTPDRWATTQHEMACTKRWLANGTVMVMTVSCWARKRRPQRTASCCGRSLKPSSPRRRPRDSDWRSGPSDRRPGQPSRERPVFYVARHLADAAAAALTPSLCPWWEHICHATDDCICTQHTAICADSVIAMGTVIAATAQNPTGRRPHRRLILTNFLCDNSKSPVWHMVQPQCNSSTKAYKNSSGDEIANVNFFYDDTAHVLQNTKKRTYFV